jgi:hypothetical protein
LSWMAVAGAGISIGGGLLGNALGGESKSPLYKFQRSFAPALYGPHGFGQAMKRDRQHWNQFYNQLIGMQKGLGKAGRTAINKNLSATNAQADQSLINRGLYNTTVTDAEHSANRAEARDAKQTLREHLLAGRMGLMMGREQQNQSMKDQYRQLQMMLFTGPGGQMSNSFGPQQDNSGLSYLLTQLIGGGIGGLMGGGGGGQNAGSPGFSEGGFFTPQSGYQP